MSGLLLIEHCAPTLAGIKTANLFSCSYGSTKELFSFLMCWNRELNPKGVYLKLMKAEGERALIYVYRKQGLAEDLKNEEAKRYLKLFGYDAKSLWDLEKVLKILKNRICREKDFPHEIGFFLGYPPADVVGFIENKGKNFKLSGCWKVYENVAQAEKSFSKYKKCRNVYKKVYESGKTVSLLTVPVRVKLDGLS